MALVAVTLAPSAQRQALAPDDGDGAGSWRPNWWLGPTFMMQGERHSGTNFLSHQLTYNFGQGFRQYLQVSRALSGEREGCDSTVEDQSLHLCCCCKHGFGSAACNASFTPALKARVFVVRHPFTWLLQMHTDDYEVHPDGCEDHGSNRTHTRPGRASQLRPPCAPNTPLGCGTQVGAFAVVVAATADLVFALLLRR